MKNADLVIKNLVELALADNETDREKALEALRLNAANVRPENKDPEYLIRQILLDIGAPDHLTGHPYVVEAVKMALEDWHNLANITRVMYPRLAEKFNTTAPRVERAIRHAIEVAWERGDYEELNRYFGNVVSPDKGKPTNSEFIARFANIIRQRIL